MPNKRFAFIFLFRGQLSKPDLGGTSYTLPTIRDQKFKFVILMGCKMKPHTKRRMVTHFHVTFQGSENVPAQECFLRTANLFTMATRVACPAAWVTVMNRNGSLWNEFCSQRKRVFPGWILHRIMWSRPRNRIQQHSRTRFNSWAQIHTCTHTCKQTSTAHSCVSMNKSVIQIPQILLHQGL